MRFAELVATMDAVAATRSRLAKVDVLRELLRALSTAEIAPAVGMLTGRVRQGRIGVGWRTLAQVGAEHPTDATLEILDVDAALDRLAAAGGAGSVAARSAELAALASRATPAEWDAIGRILLGDVRTGALEGVLLDAIARAADRAGPAVRRAAMLSGDLGETARIALTADEAALSAVSLQVGRPVLPMLASSAPDVGAALGVTGPASVEHKLDGARIQVHRDGDEVRVYTRGLADITDRLPAVVEAVRELSVRTAIFDGETLALDEDGAPRPFQDTMARFGSETATDRALRPWLFDVLHVDGRDLIDLPLSERLDELERIAPRLRVPAIRVEGPDEASVAEQFAREALAAGQEGIMVKALESLYAAGRRGKNWIKVKPVLTYDLVVLAVEWGSGRRQGLLSNLHLGARDPDGAVGAAGGYVMVGKTFKGMTDETLRWQTEHFLARRVGGAGHIVVVEPDTVVEIAIDGVQRSVRYPGGVALRFARVKGYRPDRTPDTADTITALRALLPGDV